MHSFVHFTLGKTLLATLDHFIHGRIAVTICSEKGISRKAASLNNAAAGKA
jgi:hypothetical protein